MADEKEAPVMEMRQTGNGWRGSKPLKVNRRRIQCPKLPHVESSQRPGDLQRERRRQYSSLEPVPNEPLEVVLRVLYFSHDGNPADTGSTLEFHVMTSTTVDSLLGMARAAIGVGNVGRLVFKSKPLVDGQESLSAVGVASDPKALHMMLPRKFRPANVAEAAATEAAELANAMAQAEAEFKSRPPRQRKKLVEEE
mmetsp:Transcript_100822/g.194946  ORF Transcript_100822/g.194946 Transcript_100822/m.194946 type:complete len:196 (-) Transcript_100822:210-797(-)|eukprot:CAMPEP_0172719326 /NCGR_PEP_ID=MMETSP1074-20121228/75439_1 /TAXON_ID=2916 /ORGANISM="Ceratium fusus, Strain PA161109" /LENGTH=195 /DNA_ID=CAMNT_0013544665 /DNA_START=61 /DNA_END=648 /DNA_ORIENTATION=+